MTHKLTQQQVLKRGIPVQEDVTSVLSSMTAATRKATIQKKDRRGNSALHYAAFKNLSQIVRCLLDNGAGGFCQSVMVLFHLNYTFYSTFLVCGSLDVVA